jgi:hypothetical protein
MVVVEVLLRAFGACRRACLRAPRSALLSLLAITLLLVLLGSPDSPSRPVWDEDQDGDGEIIPAVQTQPGDWDGVIPDFAALMPPSTPAPGSLAHGAGRWPRLALPLDSRAPVEEPFSEAHRSRLYPTSHVPHIAPTAAGVPSSTFARDWQPLADGMGDAWLRPSNRPVQHDFSGWKDSDVERERREAVRNGFIWAWEAYKRHAWGHDEIKPVSALPSDPFNGWGATIIESVPRLSARRASGDLSCGAH